MLYYPIETGDPVSVYVIGSGLRGRGGDRFDGTDLCEVVDVMEGEQPGRLTGVSGACPNRYGPDRTSERGGVTGDWEIPPHRYTEGRRGGGYRDPETIMSDRANHYRCRRSDYCGHGPRRGRISDRSR